MSSGKNPSSRFVAAHIGVEIISLIIYAAEAYGGRTPRDAAATT